jgi:flavin reductase (DIM6/NTAB) family NADH-FMN oxidoreductase RutF
VTANSFTSLSLVPPLVLVCLRRNSAAASAIASNRAFAINVLSAAQEPLGRRFASPGRPRGQRTFAGVAHRAARTGAPILDGVACWFDCSLSAMPVAGDHVIVIGEILDYEGDAAREPLIFHAGRYRAVSDRGASAPRGTHFPLVEFTRKEVKP